MCKLREGRTPFLLEGGGAEIRGHTPRTDILLSSTTIPDASLLSDHS